jgi:hypothetical protein
VMGMIADGIGDLRSLARGRSWAGGRWLSSRMGRARFRPPHLVAWCHRATAWRPWMPGSLAMEGPGETICRRMSDQGFMFPRSLVGFPKIVKQCGMSLGAWIA